MKKINNYKIVMIMVFSMVLIVPTAAFSKTNVVTFNGTIEGALCAIEGEVILSDSAYGFLKNDLKIKQSFSAQLKGVNEKTNLHIVESVQNKSESVGS